MAKCGYCGSTIVIGGVRAGEQRYCNNTCCQHAYILRVAQNIPPAAVDRQVEEVWRGNCPRCGQLGPVDVHKVHKVWSALVLTRWTTESQVSCRSCATKSQLGGMAFSLLCGWWGFPWGLVLTPVQITRNAIAMTTGRDAAQPSSLLRKLVLVNLGAQLAARQNGAAQPPPLPPAMK